MRRWWLRLGSYAAREKTGTALLLALSLLGVGLEALLPWPLKLVVDYVLPDEPLPAAARWIGGLPGAATSAGLLAWLAAGLVLALAGAQGVQLVKSMLQAGVAGRMQYRLAADLFDRLQRLSLAYHAAGRKGDLVHRIAVDSACVPSLVSVALSLATALLTLVVLFTIMWRLDPVLALVAAGVALPMGLLIRILGARMTERAYHQQQLEGEIWNVAEQTLTALPAVQAFGREEHEQRRFRGASSRTIQAYMRSLASQLQFKIGVDGSVALGTAAVMLIGGWHVLGGAASLGTLVVFLSYLTALYAPLLILAYASSTYAGAAASARRVIEVLDANDEVREAPQARPLPAPRSRRGSHLVMDRVSFGYEPGRPVLKHLSLEVLPGETLALAGATGAGKSTLVSLIPRLFDPWDGRVLIDGCDLRTATLASVRSRVALVLQDPFLLPVSIAENVAYGSPRATRAQIVAACIAANADEFIRCLPHGYEQIVGERGATLSGGERQRLAIARALLRNAPLLLLDEPTAALDAKTEALVMEAIGRLAAGRTTIVIAHRPATLRRADRVVVLEAGRIAPAARGEHWLRGLRG